MYWFNLFPSPFGVLSFLISLLLVDGVQQLPFNFRLLSEFSHFLYTISYISKNVGRWLLFPSPFGVLSFLINYLENETDREFNNISVSFRSSLISYLQTFTDIKGPFILLISVSFRSSLISYVKICLKEY